MSMIPYLQIPSLPIAGSLAIHPFGVMVATGILLGAWLTQRHGLKFGLPEEKTRSMIFWSVFTGMVVAHVSDVLVYQSHHGWDALWAILDPRSGLSSMGGFAGAVLGLYIWCHRNNEEVLGYADSLAYGLAIGWMFGRMGCFLAHDHPGLETHSFFGVDYPCPQPSCPPIPESNGGFAVWTNPQYRRFDLGFIEVLVAGALSLFYFLCARFLKPRKGFYVAAIATYYGPVRFFLDYLRIRDQPGADPRWLGLTPAQYAALLVTAVGIGLCVYVARRRPIEYPSS